MSATVFWLLLWLVVITVFALSNLAPLVTVRFWQWKIVEEAPLGTVIIAAGLLGALMTYAGSVLHHLRQARQIRSLQQSVRTHEARETPPLAADPAPPATPGAFQDPRRPP